MPRATHLQTLGDASPYTAFRNKVRFIYLFIVFVYYLHSSFFRHDIAHPIEGDDWTKVNIIAAAAAGSNDSAP